MNTGLHKASDLLFVELLSSLLLSSIPSSIVIPKSNIMELIHFLKGVSSPEHNVLYLAFFKIAHFTAWAVNYYLYTPIDRVSKLKLFLLQATVQVGFTLLGVNRVIAGTLLSSIPAFYFVQPTLVNLQATTYSVLLAFSCIWISSVLSCWSANINAKEAR